jgi:hypothetical protein
MLDFKYFFTTKFVLFVFVALLGPVDAEAQVVVDVSKLQDRKSRIHRYMARRVLPRHSWRYEG